LDLAHVDQGEESGSVRMSRVLCLLSRGVFLA
jgi:hypothetical protein